MYVRALACVSIYPRAPTQGKGWETSVRRWVSFENKGFQVFLQDAFSLKINYLTTPVRSVFAMLLRM